MRTFCFITAGIFILAWLFFPNLFPWWAIHVWFIPIEQLDEMGKLGPLGDIYGSLNTLFTSVTLIIVMYSAYLQRQANRDAREAMAEQLIQAREASDEQIRQAKEATEEQLKQARETTIQQMDLAQSTHEAQIQETKNSFFTNQFYSLLNFKNERIKTLVLRDVNNNTISGYEVFTVLQSELFKNICLKYKDDWDIVTKEVISQEFREISTALNNGHTFYEIFTYYEIYSSLFELIETASINEKQKFFYSTLVRQSTTPSEQLTLFYLIPMWDRLHVSLEGSKIFISFGPGQSEGFALKFYNKSFFYTSEWYAVYDNQQTPA